VVLGLLPVARAAASDYDTLCVQAYDCALYDPNACGSSNTPAKEISGDLKSLAQQILSNSNVSFDYGPGGPTGTQFKRLANGQQAQTDDGRNVDVEPIILVTILHIAQKHKINVSALTDGSSHTSPANPHGAGKAADLNILDGSHTNGQDSVADTIVASAAEVLPENSRFGLGANGNVAVGSKQINGKTFVTFSDHPTHVHVDVMGVSQAADDKAVQSAAGSQVPAGTNTSNVYILGDSITVKSQDHIQQVFQSKGYTANIDGSSSRTINGPGIDGNKLSGIDAIAQDKNKIKQASAIVVELGTNGGASKDNIDKTISSLTAINSTAQVYWVDTISVGRTDNYNKNTIESANKNINAEAASQKYSVISWFRAVDPSGNPESPTQNEKDPNNYIDSSDGLGVHPTDRGSTALANLIADSVAGKSNSQTAQSVSCCPNTSSGPLSGDTNAAKAFNYFVQQKNLSAVAAAGIVGNMMVESGRGSTEDLDTHAHNDISGTHDGIVQWSTSRWAALKQHESGDPYDLSVQLDYVWYELTTTYTATLKAMKATNSPQEAASIFDNGPPVPAFEASGQSGNDAGRRANAQKIFDKYGGGGSTSNIITSSSSNDPSSSDCAGSSSSNNSATNGDGPFWPFATKSTSQYQRVDQGWDLQASAGATIYAIASGTVNIYMPNPGPGLFGNDYPVLKLDKSIGGPSDWIYYGHAHIDHSLIGKHVNAGQAIGHTNKYDGENGSGVQPGWLEIGFSTPNTDAPLGHGAFPTAEGTKMKEILIKANPASH
jgi:lysophospholipase L1-like esterase